MGFIVLIFVLITSFCGKAYSQDTSCDIVWYPPIQLSPDSLAGVNTPLVAAQGDTIHVIYQGTEPFIGIPYHRSVNNGQLFEPLRDIVPDSVGIVQALSIISSMGKLYAFFRASKNNGAFYEAYFIKSDDRGDTWSIPYKFPDTLRFTHAAARGDTIVVTGWKPKQYYSFRSSTDGGKTWKNSRYSYNGNSNRLTMTPGTVHFVKQWGVDSIEFVILYRKSTDLGETWSDSIPVSPLGARAYESVIAADDANDSAKIFVGWKDARYGCRTLAFCSIFERHLSLPDSVWSEETVLTPEPRGAGPEVAVKMPLAVVTWIAEVPPNFYVMARISKDDGRTWCTPYQVGIDLPQKVAISSNAVHIVYGYGLTNPYRIIYRRGVVLPTAAKETNETVPKHFSFEQNYPNPFNPTTKIRYKVPNTEYVSITVYDVFGREVTTLVDERKQPGEYEIEWNGEGFTSGVYFIRMKAGNYFFTMKAVLMK